MTFISKINLISVILFCTCLYAQPRVILENNFPRSVEFHIGKLDNSYNEVFKLYPNKSITIPMIGEFWIKIREVGQQSFAPAYGVFIDTHTLTNRQAYNDYLTQGLYRKRLLVYQADFLLEWPDNKNPIYLLQLIERMR